MLSKLGLRSPEEQLPFDMVRCTLDGIVELIAKGFRTSSASTPIAPPTHSCSDDGDGFFPLPPSQRPFLADPVAIWLLFRSQHACFTHFDLNDDGVVQEFQRRITAWDALLTPDHTAAANRPTSVTFFRTVIAERPEDEVEMLPRLHDVLRTRTQGTMPFRTVMVVHDQAPATQPLFILNPASAQQSSPCVVWNLKRQRLKKLDEEDEKCEKGTDTTHSMPSLFDECHDGYQTIITSMAKELKWNSLQSTLPSWESYQHSQRAAGLPVFRPYTELSRVNGISAVRGSCRGFGSTYSAALGKCVYCGSTDGHAINPTQFDTGRAWTDDDVSDLLMHYAMHHCDAVAAVEATALHQQRGANETFKKLQEVLSD